MHLKEIATLGSVSREQCRTYWSGGGGGGGGTYSNFIFYNPLSV